MKSKSLQTKAIYSPALNSVKILKKDSNGIQQQQNTNLKTILDDVNLKLTSTNTNKTSRVRLTIMLMTFPITYLITTLPLFIIIACQLISQYLVTNLNANFEAEFAVFKTLMFFNNSFNILFFILFGKSLRKDMVNLFKCNSRQTNKLNSNCVSHTLLTQKSNIQFNYNTNNKFQKQSNQENRLKTNEKTLSNSTKFSP